MAAAHRTIAASAATVATTRNPSATAAFIDVDDLGPTFEVDGRSTAATSSAARVAGGGGMVPSQRRPRGQSKTARVAGGKVVKVRQRPGEPVDRTLGLGQSMRRLGQKFQEAFTEGADPYVKAYLGTEEEFDDGTWLTDFARTICRRNVEADEDDRHHGRTDAVVGNADNDDGKQPVWTQDNRIELRAPTKRGGAEYLTLEVWDSDIDADDYLGGRQLHLSEVHAKAGQLLHVQLYHRGGVTGRDAGLLRVRVTSCETVDDGEAVHVVLDVLGAVGLLPDTPPIRDLLTFSDWRNTQLLLAVLCAYLLLGTLYFWWFFGEYAQAPPLPPMSRRAHAAAGCGEAQAGSWGAEAEPRLDGAGDEQLAASGSYPTDSGPLVDALLFELGTVTTVGWGHHPVNFADRSIMHAEDSSRWLVYSGTMCVQAANIIVGIVMLGLLVGSMGQSFRSCYRRRLHRRMQRALEAAMGSVADLDKMSSAEQADPKTARTIRHKIRRCCSPTVFSLVLLSVVIFAAALVFSSTEDLPMVPAIYMTVVSVSTVGYGQFAPTTTSSKLFACVFTPLGVALAASAIDSISSTITTRRTEEIERYVLSQFGEVGSLDNNELSMFDYRDLKASVQRQMDTSFVFEDLKRSVHIEHAQHMSRNDFRLAMLLRMGRISSDETTYIDRVFDSLDAQDKGFLSMDAVVRSQDDSMGRRIARLDEICAGLEQRQQPPMSNEV